MICRPSLPRRSFMGLIPTPSSRTERTSSSSVSSNPISMFLGSACLTALCVASWAIRYRWMAWNPFDAKAGREAVSRHRIPDVLWVPSAKVESASTSPSGGFPPVKAPVRGPWSPPRPAADARLVGSRPQCLVESPQPLFRPLSLADIHEGRGDAFDTPVLRSVRRDSP